VQVRAASLAFCFAHSDTLGDADDFDSDGDVDAAKTPTAKQGKKAPASAAESNAERK